MISVNNYDIARNILETQAARRGIDANFKREDWDTFNGWKNRGKNIMKGYLFDKKLTIRSFKKDFYLTGDLAYVDKNGFYYIIKRKDKIIKRFGFKIQPSTIENKINALNYVKKSKIQFLEKDKMILKVFANKKDKKIQIQIRTILRSNFASYEIPDEIIIIEPDDQKYNIKD